VQLAIKGIKGIKPYFLIYWKMEFLESFGKRVLGVLGVTVSVTKKIYLLMFKGV
jgi:hypothetical protein